MYTRIYVFWRLMGLVKVYYYTTILLYVPALFFLMKRVAFWKNWVPIPAKWTRKASYHKPTNRQCTSMAMHLTYGQTPDLWPYTWPMAKHLTYGHAPDLWPYTWPDLYSQWPVICPSKSITSCNLWRMLLLLSFIKRCGTCCSHPSVNKCSVVSSSQWGTVLSHCLGPCQQFSIGAKSGLPEAFKIAV